MDQELMNLFSLRKVLEDREVVLFHDNFPRHFFIYLIHYSKLMINTLYISVLIQIDLHKAYLANLKE